MRLISLLVLLAGCQSDYEVIPEPPDVDPGDVAPCGFTRVADTAFYAYDCNPVFSTSGEDWAPTIRSTAFNVTSVMGHPFYQLWYTGAPVDDATGGQWALGYAVSAEGTEWDVAAQNPLLTAPKDPRAWNFNGMDQLQVVWDPEMARYVGLYQGYNLSTQHSSWGLGSVTSPDGVAWTQSPQNPVMDLAAGVGSVVGWCWPLGIDLGSVGGYRGYVAGYDRAGGACQMYRIVGTDPDSWQPTPELVLRAGAPNDWDDQGYISAAVSLLGDTWYTFFTGFGDWEEYVGYRTSKNHFFGYATSTDGATWTKVQGIVPLHRTQEGQVGSVAAHRVGDRIHLWIGDDYDGVTAVGYFLFDPARAEGEDTGE